MENNQYLGTEKVGKLLSKFAIPCIFSLIISCLYNIVDQIFVGNGIGYLGNAATGVIFPITVVGWGMSLFFGDGAAAHLSVALGRNETETIHRGVGNAALCSFLSGVAIIVISYLCGDGLLRLIGATDANLVMAHDYGFIIYAMMPLAMVQNTLASIIRADGSPRYAMGAMLVGAVINIIGDPVAIFVLNMGIKGAAYATILGQFVSFVICVAYLTKSKTFRLSGNSLRLDFTLLKHIMALGTSSLLTQLSIVVITVINNILLVRYGAISAYGADIPLAAFVVIMKLFQIVLNIAIGIAAGAQPVVGYNYGAGKYGRVRELLTTYYKNNERGGYQMKRIKAACIRQTLHFMLKEDLGHEYARKMVQEEVKKYKTGLDRNRTQYKILSETELEDGSIVMEIIKQYNTSPVGDYLK